LFDYSFTNNNIIHVSSALLKSKASTFQQIDIMGNILPTYYCV